MRENEEYFGIVSKVYTENEKIFILIETSSESPVGQLYLYLYYQNYKFGYFHLNLIFNALNLNDKCFIPSTFNKEFLVYSEDFIYTICSRNIAKTYHSVIKPVRF